MKDTSPMRWDDGRWSDCEACQRQVSGRAPVPDIPHIHVDPDVRARPCCLRRVPYVGRAHAELKSKIMRCESWCCVCSRCNHGKGCGPELAQGALSRMYSYLAGETVWVHAVNLSQLARASAEPTTWEYWGARVSAQLSKRARARRGSYRIVVTPDEYGDLIGYVFANVDLSNERVKEGSLATRFEPLGFEAAWALLHSVVVVGQTRTMKWGSRSWPVTDKRKRGRAYRALIRPRKDNVLTDWQLAQTIVRLKSEMGEDLLEREDGASPTASWAGTPDAFNQAAEEAAKNARKWDVSGRRDDELPPEPWEVS